MAKAAKSTPTTRRTTPGGTYEPVAYIELPGWSEDDHLAALRSFRSSCPRLISSRRGDSGKANPYRTSKELAAACAAAMTLPEKATRRQAREFFERHFQPHRVVHNDVDGLFTGYFEPVLEGSRTRQGRFQTAVMKRPPELVTVVPETKSAFAAKLTHARMTPGGLVPFATRAEIQAGALDGRNLEILYLASPVDKFFLQIQGAGRVHLTDGTTVRLQYDGKNGHPFTSIGRYLIDKGMLAADRLSMGALGRWLKSDLERAHAVMNQNASYVFFREITEATSGPLGAMNTTLETGRSLAVDPKYHALGSPIYVSAPSLTHSRSNKPFNRLMVAHDVGSAIKGPERGDIYFGTGESAARIAGKTKHRGNFYVLLANRATIAETVTGSLPDRRKPRP